MSVLITKYRPSNLDEIFGQEMAVSQAKGYLRDPSSRSILLHGPTGCGKTTMARVIAASLNCVVSGPEVACGTCRNCVKVINSSPGSFFHEINAAKDRGIDLIRTVVSQQRQRAMGAKYNVFSFDEVQGFTPAAWAAFLKDLEEPKSVILLQTMDVSKVPKAVRDRCLDIAFKPLSESKIIDLLTYVCGEEEIPLSPDHIKSLAQVSNGSPRDALSNLEGLNRSIQGSTSKDSTQEFIDKVVSERITTLVQQTPEALTLMFLSQLFMGTNDANSASIRLVRQSTLWDAGPLGFATALCNTLRNLGISRMAPGLPLPAAFPGFIRKFVDVSSYKDKPMRMPVLIKMTEIYTKARTQILDDPSYGVEILEASTLEAMLALYMLKPKT